MYTCTDIYVDTYTCTYIYIYIYIYIFVYIHTCIHTNTYWCTLEDNSFKSQQQKILPSGVWCVHFTPQMRSFHLFAVMNII